MVPGGSRVWLIQMSPGMDSWDPKSCPISQHPNIFNKIAQKKTTYYLSWYLFFFRSVVSLQYWNLRKKMVYQMGGLQSLDCEMNGAALPKGWQRQWLMGWNGISTGSQTDLSFCNSEVAGELVHISRFWQMFPVQKTFRFVGETGYFVVGFWVGPHRFFHPGFLSVVQWGHWLSKSLEKISHKRIPTESLPNGSTQRVAGGKTRKVRLAV